MHSATFIVLALAAGIPAALADFDIYSADTGDESGNVSGFSVYEVDQDAPSFCDVSMTSFVWRLRDDVSGMSGFRCVGGEGCDFPDQVTELEMNFGDDLHITIYADSDWQMYGTDGRRYGHCELLEDFDYNCTNEGAGEDHTNIDVRGSRYFRCYAEYYAGMLNDAGWSSQ